MTTEKTRHLVTLALFVALILLLGLTPVGMIPLGFINLTTLQIPVIVGTMLLGISDGVVLGLCFGLVSVYKAFTGASTLVAPLLATSPLDVVAMSIIPRLLVPVVTWLVFRALKGKKRGMALAAAAGSLTNTVFYLGLMLLLYVINGIDAAPVLGIIGGTGLLGGGGEAVLSALVAAPVCVAVGHLNRKKGK